MKTKLLMIPALAAAVAACSPGAKQEDHAAQDSLTMAGVQEPMAPELTKVWETDTTMTTCESVLYDKGNNVLLVSNIAGNPTDKDGVGFISILHTDGTVATEKWVTGLDAPKGMGLRDDKLYVTNISELVEISRGEGKILKRYPVKDAQFLNDVAIYGDKVYCSDMNTGKIHVLDNGKVALFADGLENINGLTVDAKGMLCVLDNKGLRKLDMDGNEAEMINDQVTGGDGLVMVDDSTYIASRWQGEIYLVKNGKEHLLLDTKAQESQTADIGYIPARSLVLVPTFFKNKVVAYKLMY